MAHTKGAPPHPAPRLPPASLLTSEDLGLKDALISQRHLHLDCIPASLLTSDDLGLKDALINQRHLHLDCIPDHVVIRHKVAVGVPDEAAALALGDLQ